MKKVGLILSLILALSSVASAQAKKHQTPPKGEAKVRFSATTPHVATLTWTASTTSGVGYNVYRSTTTGAEAPPALNGTTPVAVSCSGATCTYADSANLVEGTTYFWVVRAVVTNSGGTTESVNSNEVSATVPTTPPAPPNPPTSPAVKVQ
jgi:hypothetical protein